MNDFKIRCSAIGQIMTNPSKKSALMSKSSMNYCKEWVKEQIYGRKKTFESKYTDKGIIMEDNALDFIADYLDYSSLLKNEKYFENDFLTGTPDVVLKDHIIELKNSWNCFSFPLFDDQINKAYYYQCQGYLALTGLKRARLIYALMDTPDHLIEKEYKFSLNNFLDYSEFEKNYLYNGIAAKYRIKIFEIERDDKTIDSIINRVIVCRNYINELLTFNI